MSEEDGTRLTAPQTRIPCEMAGELGMPHEAEHTNVTLRSSQPWAAALSCCKQAHVSSRQDPFSSGGIVSSLLGSQIAQPAELTVCPGLELTGELLTVSMLDTKIKSPRVEVETAVIGASWPFD